ncbi:MULTISPECIES: DUF3551 domain-containing protein [Bradyrhizobium]|uniref:DUF3551 domain-containing protein n=1 Tax=Bradyrhizobium ivorense TaxID=2511166 RepID=A0A508TGB3_9BRAD|nr:DUF3551 domain-containing protein [Bradyrhizobium ivorense]VIO73097.1 hypothetical protein CI1B_47000 [Bradyrhizobium ivorense]
MTAVALRTTTIPAVTLAVAIALGAMFASSAARAGEFCSLDGDFTKDCGFSSMEQCQATRSGIGGWCLLNPSNRETGITAINRNAYAYAPRLVHHERSGRTATHNK